MLGFQLAFDVTGDPAFPEKPAFEVARELGVPVTTHAGVWGATNDDGIRLMHDHGFMTPGDDLRARGDADRPTPTSGSPATGGSVSVSTESEQSAGQGYPPTWALRTHGIPVSLSMDTSACGGAATCSPPCAPRWAPTARASTWRRTRRATPSRTPRCAPSRSWSGPPAAAPRALGRERRSAASRSARRPTWCCSRTTHSPVSFPMLNPYGHVAFQAQRGDVHTVLVERPGREARRPPGRTSTWRRSGGTVEHDGRAPALDRWARRRGGGHEPRGARSRRCSTTRTPTPTTRAAGPTGAEPAPARHITMCPRAGRC